MGAGYCRVGEKGGLNFCDHKFDSAHLVRSWDEAGKSIGRSREKRGVQRLMRQAAGDVALGWQHATSDFPLYLECRECAVSRLSSPSDARCIVQLDWYSNSVL